MIQPVSFYDDYKPFRNYMRRFDLLQSLVDVWAYALHLIEDGPLPTGYAIGLNPSTTGPIRRHVYPWDLDILARELVLNAGTGGSRSLKRWNDLAVALNHVRRLDGVAFERDGVPQVDVMFEIHRIANRQFPWQTNIGVNPMMRAFKVFGAAAVEAIVIRELGMTTRQFILLGAAVNGHFLKGWGMSTNQDYSVLGISREASDAFFKRITCTIKELKAETVKQQSYDRDWLYAWNPLEASPLVSFDPTFPDRVICPIPRYLTRRVSAGIFYDLVKSADFDNQFGNSFQSYVGEVIRMTCPSPRFTIRAEESYYVGNNKMHGVDWILSDSTGHLFIEAKTKRLTVNAKTRADAVALNKELLVMATAIVQNYRNITDALDGKTSWIPDGLAIFPLVLTLEDWFIISPRVGEMLNGLVRRLLADAGIPDRVLEEMPYTTASAHEFEIASQVVGQIGIAPLMSKKAAPDQRRWSLLPVIREEFKDEMQRVNWCLFGEEFLRLTPKLPGE